jgi:hypothetical protein
VSSNVRRLATSYLSRLLPGRRTSVALWAFDENFYRAQAPEGLQDGQDAFDHYSSEGWRRALDPTPWFSTQAYLEANLDVAAADICPFIHYIEQGRREQRPLQDAGRVTPNPESRESSGPASRSRRGKLPRRRSAEELAHALVDADFYTGMYPDVAAAGLSAGSHFMRYGWAEGRDPNPWFSQSAYLFANSDVRDAGVNPFVHWLGEGRHEQRPLGQRSVSAWGLVLAQKSIEDVAKDWVGERASFHYAVEDVIKKVGARSQEGGKLLVLVGSDDYRHNLGGVQLCLRYEADHFRSAGDDVLYLHPLIPLPMLALDEPPALQPILNGEPLPVVRTEDVATLVREICSRRGRTLNRMVIHGLLGHSPSALVEQAAALRVDVDYWVHDFLAACSGYQLMRNNVTWCGAPPVASTSCGLCTHGRQRSAHIDNFAPLLSYNRLSVCAPSEVAAERWMDATGFPGKVEVVPHGYVAQPAAAAARPRRPGPPTLAFLGHPAYHKGWEEFLMVRKWALSRGDMQLAHLGSDDQSLPGVRFIPVDGSTEGGMTQALLRIGVDAAFLWPLIPETFSLVAHEAIAAGCQIVTNARSGNVVVASERCGRDLTFDDSRQLKRALVTGSLAALLREQPLGPPSDFVWSGLTPARLGASQSEGAR